MSSAHSISSGREERRWSRFAGMSTPSSGPSKWTKRIEFARRSGERFRNAGLGLSQDFWRQNRPHVIILFRESVGVSQEVQARRRAIIEQLKEDTETAILEIMREQGREDPLVADTVAMAIEGIFERLAYRYLIWDDRPEEIEPVVGRVMDFIAGGMMSVLKNLGEPEPVKSRTGK